MSNKDDKKKSSTTGTQKQHQDSNKAKPVGFNDTSKNSDNKGSKGKK